jgi:hypothetical protein
METSVAYRGRSGVTSSGDLRFAANVLRDQVAFAGDLRDPLRFRELFSAMHEVVVADLRYHAKDHTAYRAWLKDEGKRREVIARQARQAKREELENRREQPLPPGLEKDYRQCRAQYWKARGLWEKRLWQEDAELLARLRPRDPVVTVADDQVLFECFSTDESSYASLGVDRDGFSGGADAAYGTTNVDYSWDLYEHIQTLRSYHPARFAVAPEGIAVQVGEAPAYQEQKIDLPASWLRGFGQISAAAGLPGIRVPLSREVLYAVLSHLRRHRERTGPRALRIELLTGRPVRLVLEPWETVIEVPGATWQGPDLAPIRLWGRRRLLPLARALPLIDSAEIHTLGSGMPWFVVLRCGTMRFNLGLSGWTVNDWTRSAALDLLAGSSTPEESDLQRVTDELHRTRSRTFAQLRPLVSDSARLGACLTHLASTGQVIHDLASGVYRWRQVMPRALGEAERGPDHPELVACRALLAERGVRAVNASDQGRSGTVLTGKVQNQVCEVLISTDGHMRKATCGCSFFRAGGLRQGPCRHLLALRLAWQQQRDGISTSIWSIWK